jgi:2-polyprenyl-6-methoxyphenol hydroxylase-like FAD-dependent oxidoreductase
MVVPLTRQAGRASKRRALIIGGSLGGLFAGVLLRSIGWTVDIFERSPHDLDSRGGGIVLQPEVIQAFQRAGVRYDASIGVVAKERVYLARDGSVAQRIAMRQILTAWTTLYADLRRHFPAAHYHQGAVLTRFDQAANGVTVHFADGQTARGDLLVGADGGGSVIRRQLLPETEAEYAGYVAWRGLVDEPDLPASAAEMLSERFVFYQFSNSHILEYLVPGEHDAIEPGQRRYNWVWYRNLDEKTELPNALTDRNGRRRTSSMPPGLVAPAVDAELRSAADKFLPPQFRQLVAATKEPFFQTIIDLSVPQMAFGRVALVGDAAFVPRPHTAASTSKAAGNALALIEALVHVDHDVEAALKIWQPQQLEIGNYLRQHGKALGNSAQFFFSPPVGET